MATLTARDRSRIKYHLGYLSVQMAASIQYGIPRPIQTIFLVETAMSNVIDDGFNITNILRLLGNCDLTECQMLGGQDYLAGEQVGNLKPRPDQIERLREAYNYWCQRLADTLGVPLYPYAAHAQAAAGMMYGNVRVRH